VDSPSFPLSKDENHDWADALTAMGRSLTSIDSAPNGTLQPLHTSLPRPAHFKIQIPASWTNPTGDFRVGLKAAFELFPPSLATRVRVSRMGQTNPLFDCYQQ
jgi:hypothetical protein